MAAIGLGAPHDLAEAMRLLEQAAAQGHALAAASLALILEEGGIDPWLTPAPAMTISQAPRVLTIGGFISPAVCAWLTERARPSMRPATVFDNLVERETRSGSRTNSAVQIRFEDSDMILALVREKIARATGLPVAGLEPTQVLHYAPGQAFETHHDYLDPETPGHLSNLVRNGQRMATFLIYLNDGFEGGETEMASIGLRHRGKPGDALFWANVTPDGRPDPLTIHAGLPPSSGEKWLLSQWLRNRAPTPGPDQSLVSSGTP